MYATYIKIKILWTLKRSIRIKLRRFYAQADNRVAVTSFKYKNNELDSRNREMVLYLLVCSIMQCPGDKLMFCY